MTPIELRLLLRRDYLDALQSAPDSSDPYWPDEDLDQFLVLAEREACRSSRLIRHEGSIVLSTDTCRYPIDETVTDIDQVFYSSGEQTELQRIEETRMRCRESGMPWAWYMRGQDLHVWPKPSTEASGLEITFIGFRLPSYGPNDSLCGRFPEVPAQYHEHLLYYAAYLALIRNDADSQNSPLAQHYLTMFQSYFGKSINAEARQQRREMADQIVVRPC